MKNQIPYKEWKKEALNLAKKCGLSKNIIKDVLAEDSMKLSWELGESFDELYNNYVEYEMLKAMGR